MAGMDTFEEATPAAKSGMMGEAVCWECGEKRQCYEYVVCCTGTLFHICPECEEKTNEKPSCAVESEPKAEAGR